jgi:hypothetical protein
MLNSDAAASAFSDLLNLEFDINPSSLAPWKCAFSVQVRTRLRLIRVRNDRKSTGLRDYLEGYPCVRVQGQYR